MFYPQKCRAFLAFDKCVIANDDGLAIDVAFESFGVANAAKCTIGLFAGKHATCYGVAIGGVKISKVRLSK